MKLKGLCKFAIDPDEIAAICTPDDLIGHAITGLADGDLVIVTKGGTLIRVTGPEAKSLYAGVMTADPWEPFSEAGEGD
jgi:hypothetical protein